MFEIWYIAHPGNPNSPKHVIIAHFRLNVGIIYTLGSLAISTGLAVSDLLKSVP